MSWACDFAFSQKSSYRHLFRRSLIGVPDPFPPFLSTPPLTQPSLQTEIRKTGANSRGGLLFGRMAEQSSITKDIREWLWMTMTMTVLTCSLVKKALTCPRGKGAWAVGYLVDEEHTLSANTMKRCVSLRSRAACRLKYSGLASVSGGRCVSVRMIVMRNLGMSAKNPTEKW